MSEKTKARDEGKPSLPKSASSPPRSAVTQGGFLSGAGDGRLTKNLHLSSRPAGLSEPAKDLPPSSLLEKLRNFLPALEKANATLPLQGIETGAVEIIPAGMSSDDDHDEDQDDEDDDDGSTDGPKIEMNISLFPMEDDEDHDDDNVPDVTIEAPAPRKRSKQVEEL